MALIEIRNRFNGSIIWSGDAIIADAVNKAAALKVSLSSADLRSADLRSAKNAALVLARDYRNECSNGIHFYITKEEAMAHQ